MQKTTIKPGKKEDPPLKNYVKYSSLFIQMAVIIGLGTFGGYFIDKALVLQFPIFTIILSLFAVAAALYLLIKGSC